jgi:hypothetical protein
MAYDSPGGEGIPRAFGAGGGRKNGSLRVRRPAGHFGGPKNSQKPQFWAKNADSGFHRPERNGNFRQFLESFGNFRKVRESSGNSTTC